jgi:hypothetical protein
MSQPVTATLVRVAEMFSNVEALALAGFVGGHSRLTGEAHASIFASKCRSAQPT